eukprot:scaffold69330_cov61-Phaeocystis_antarctica.AAC.2
MGCANPLMPPPLPPPPPPPPLSPPPPLTPPPPPPPSTWGTEGTHGCGIESARRRAFSSRSACMSTLVSSVRTELSPRARSSVAARPPTYRGTRVIRRATAPDEQWGDPPASRRAPVRSRAPYGRAPRAAAPAPPAAAVLARAGSGGSPLATCGDALGMHPSPPHWRRCTPVGFPQRSSPRRLAATKLITAPCLGPNIATASVLRPAAVAADLPLARGAAHDARLRRGRRTLVTFATGCSQWTYGC